MSPAPPLRLDTALCDRCGKCAPVCTVRALRVGPGYISVDWEICTGCGKCVNVCDRGALTLRGAGTADPTPAAGTVAAETGPVKATRAWGRHFATAGPSPYVKVTSSSAPSAEKGAPESSSPPVRGGAAWSLAEGGLVLLVALALLIGARALPGGLGSTPVWAGVTLLVYDGALAALLWLLARRRGEGLLAAFRLDAAPRLRDALVAIGVAVGCWIFSIAYSAVARGLGASPPVDDGVGLTNVFGPGVVAGVVTFAVVAIAGPLLEEMLLRGVVLGSLARRFGIWPAIAASAIAFALLHASLWSLLPLTVLGVGLGWLATRGRSLWPAVIAHVLYNAVLVGAAFYALR